MAKYRISSIAWSFSFLGRSRPAPPSSQQYCAISLRLFSQSSQITILPCFRRSAVTRSPSATLLSARLTAKPARFAASIKLAADGSTMTFSTFSPSVKRLRSSRYSASVFCRPSLRAS